jgi:hypothetical protein
MAWLDKDKRKGRDKKGQRREDSIRQQLAAGVKLMK